MEKGWKREVNPGIKLLNCKVLRHFHLRQLDLIFAFLLVFTFGIHAFNSEDHPDYSVYQAAGNALVSSENPYAIKIRNGLDSELQYLYSPLLACVFAWSKLFSTELVSTCFLALSSVAIIFSIILLKRLNTLRNWPITGIAVSFLFFLPISKCFVLGQINLIILGLLSLFIASLKRKHFAVAGLSLALAAMLKITPAILLISLFLHGTKRALLYFILGILTLLLFTLLTPGGAEAWQFFLFRSQELGAGGYAWDHPTNYALAKLVTSLFSINEKTLGIIFSRVFAIIVIAVLVLKDRIKPISIETSSSCCILVMLLSSPILWYEHLCWAIIPFAFAFKLASARSIKVLLAISAMSLGSSIYIDTFYHLHIMKVSYEPFPILGSSMIVGPLMVFFLTLALEPELPHKPPLNLIPDHFPPQMDKNKGKDKFMGKFRFKCKGL